MPAFNQNQATPAKRNLRVDLYLDDGVTQAPLATNYTGTKATRKLGGLTANLSGLTVTVPAIGVAGNAYTLTITADGAGAGTITNVGTAYTVHYATGVTTVTNFIALLAALSGFSVTGSYVGSNTLAAGDATAALKFAGGTDSSLLVGVANASAITTYTAAAGLFVNGGYDGDWTYQFTQAELNITASEITFRVDRIPTPASITLATTHLDGIYYDKVAVGDAGNATQLQTANTGAGAGTLDESAYPLIVFKYATGTTTVKNFEDAIVASTKLAIKQYATNWTGVLTSPGDTIAATNLSGGLIFKRPWVVTSPMTYDGFDAICENGKTYGDQFRKNVAVTSQNLTGGYAGGALAAKSDDGTKTRVTFACDGTQRIATDVDLTP